MDYLDDKGPPNSAQEFVDRFNENYEAQTSQGGLAMPCLFCGAPGFTKTEVFASSPSDVQPEHVCYECHRGAKVVVELLPNGFKQCQFYQTRGPQQPDWLPNRIFWTH